MLETLPLRYVAFTKLIYKRNSDGPIVSVFVSFYGREFSKFVWISLKKLALPSFIWQLSYYFFCVYIMWIWAPSGWTLVTNPFNLGLGFDTEKVAWFEKDHYPLLCRSNPFTLSWKQVGHFGVLGGQWSGQSLKLSRRRVGSDWFNFW